MNDPISVVNGVAVPVGAAVLLAIIAIVIRLWQGSEKRHTSELTRMGAAHQAELTRLGNAHVAEVTQLRAEVSALRSRVDHLQDELDKERAQTTEALDTERRRRWKAEDAAAARRRQGERGE